MTAKRTFNYVRIRIHGNAELQFPFSVRYDRIIKKHYDRDNYDYLLLFDNQNKKLYTVVGKRVIEFYDKHFDKIDRTEGIITFDRIHTAQFGSYMLVVKSWHITGVEEAKDVNEDFLAEQIKPEELELLFPAHNFNKADILLKGGK
ncbi:MAG: hypothetical protein QW478_08370 [Candidatus Micrarchaeaceae archaeon]